MVIAAVAAGRHPEAIKQEPRVKRNVHVVGVGMIPFTKPGASDPYTVMGARAATAALKDARVDYRRVQQAYVGYVYGDSTAGQAAVYGVGLTGIPVFNLNNNCATGSSALFLARQAVESGAIECALALGFEQMQPGALKGAYDDRPSPVARFAETMTAVQGWDDKAPRAAQFFGGAGRAYMEQHGIRRDTFARISVKARQHAARCTRAPRRRRTVPRAAPCRPSPARRSSSRRSGPPVTAGRRTRPSRHPAASARNRAPARIRSHRSRRPGVRGTTHSIRWRSCC